jgi:hypothetical protein
MGEKPQAEKAHGKVPQKDAQQSSVLVLVV